MRVIVVGAGWAARHIHLPRLLANPSVSDLTVTDTDAAAAAALAEDFSVGVAAMPGYDADLVVVTTPPSTHHEIARRALLDGADVVVEKPLATSTADAVRLRRLAADRGRRLHVCHTGRYRDDVRLLTRTVQDGRLGEIHECSVRWLRRAGIPRTTGARSAGVVWDLGAHVADVVTGLLQHAPAGTVTAAGRSVNVGPEHTSAWYGSGGGATDDSVAVGQQQVGFVATALLDDGPAVHLQAAWSCATALDRVEIDVVGETGHARLRTVFGFSPDRQRINGPVLVVEDAVSGMRTTLLAEQRRNPDEYDDQWVPVWQPNPVADETALRQSVRTVALCDAIAAAVRSGRPTTIPSTEEAS